MGARYESVLQHSQFGVGLREGRKLDLKTQKSKIKVRLIKNLPTLPDILTKISRMVESKRYSADDIARVISQDQVLTARVLKLANSAFYGFSRSINSVGQALVLLGFQVVKGLILTSSVFDIVQRRATDLWKHSLAVATISGILAKRVGMKAPEESNLAGLLHDLGKVIMAVDMIEELDLVMELCDQGKTGIEAEEMILGFNHMEAGTWLAEAWKLPLELTDPITFHHDPAGARDRPLETSIVHLADILARARGFGFGRDVWVPPLQEGVLERLELSVEDLDEIVPLVHQTLVSVSDLEA
jgi:putative nucleotidyltransferase with HDIG domain